ncbi:hypothetical protein [Bifidobacterium callitrichos]|uniref:hypothetical protein n=1 Tax=Bifidobacterium callitrichos TaxID=762209 RepID=UPI001CC2735A|nr:hypothetical protein [Bifidobacterium callitrichos]
MPHLPRLSFGLSPLPRRLLRRHRRAIVLTVVTALLILLIECFGFNMPFWRTLGASMDSAAYENTMGPGLERTDTGSLRVTDPSGAWLQVETDGTSDFARVDALTPKQDALRIVHLRASLDGGTAASRTVSLVSQRSLFIPTHGAGTLRVWIEEGKNQIIPIEAIRANVRVPFTFDVTRVALMAGAVLMVVLLGPWSRLWRIALDTSRLWQRLGFAALLTPFAVSMVTNVVWQMMYSQPLVFHALGGYTYDFEQYGRLADSLLHGRTWLDLMVPPELASAADPHDVITRNRLFAEGVDPIYWDHAYFEGRWYTYFGVLPAVLLFMPYRMLSGRMLSSAAAVHLLMFLALLFTCLLVVRVIARLAPRTSVAATLIALIFVPLAGNYGYLFYRTNFYSVPFAASLTLTALGLWLWVGAQTAKPPLNPADRWQVGSAPEISLPRLGLGALCIASNFGCRPTFCLAALLGFPLFWPQIRALVSHLAAGKVSWRKALRAPGVVIAAAAVPIVPLMLYNRARFGSLFDFGTAYQMTVTDMTRFREPVADILPVIGYYLFLPLRFGDGFPWLRLSPTPLPEWSFAEPMVGGLFVLCPLLLAAFALPALLRVPDTGRTPGLRPMLMGMLVLGLALVAFDAVSAGLGWRYMCDFGWLFALAALPALLRVMGDVVDHDDMAAADASSRVCRIRPALRLIILAILMWSLLVALTCWFTPGRQDVMLSGNPRLFGDVASWFLA